MISGSNIVVGINSGLKGRCLVEEVRVTTRFRRPDIRRARVSTPG